MFINIFQFIKKHETKHFNQIETSFQSHSSSTFYILYTYKHIFKLDMRKLDMQIEFGK